MIGQRGQVELLAGGPKGRSFQSSPPLQHESGGMLARASEGDWGCFLPLTTLFQCELLICLWGLTCGVHYGSLDVVINSSYSFIGSPEHSDECRSQRTAGGDLPGLFGVESL